MKKILTPRSHLVARRFYSRGISISSSTATSRGPPRLPIRAPYEDDHGRQVMTAHWGPRTRVVYWITGQFVRVTGLGTSSMQPMEGGDRGGLSRRPDNRQFGTTRVLWWWTQNPPRPKERPMTEEGLSRRPDNRQNSGRPQDHSRPTLTLHMIAAGWCQSEPSPSGGNFLKNLTSDPCVAARRTTAWTRPDGLLLSVWLVDRPWWLIMVWARTDHVALQDERVPLLFSPSRYDTLWGAQFD